MNAKTDREVSLIPTTTTTTTPGVDDLSIIIYSSQYIWGERCYLRMGGYLFEGGDALCVFVATIRASDNHDRGTVDRYNLDQCVSRTSPDSILYKN